MKKKFYVTSSIAYVNAPPHIGFALELLQADVIARHHRLLDEDVFFLTGTDDHGLKIARKAEESGKAPQEFTDEVSEKFRELTGKLNISNDYFIRTSDKDNHWPNVFKVWKKLLEQGDIYKKSYKGLYCSGCEVFIKEKELVNGKCPLHQKAPEVVEEENYFFKLSKYSDQVKELLEKETIRIIPKVRRNEILSFIEQGIEDISCSRSKDSLKWGIPVPDDDNQVMYVWFEALINYFYPKGYWPADVHCIGKDIFRFHTLLWPAMLLAYFDGDVKKIPKNILVHGFITVDGQKISKSLGNIIDPFELVEKYGVDPVRYFLLSEIPSTGDGDFTYEKFKKRYNADLAKGLGNLVARVITLAAKSKIKPQKSKVIDVTRKWYKSSLDVFWFNDALKSIWDLISWCDKYIEQEKPWEEGKDEVISELLFAVENIAELLKPFLPETSEKILGQLKTKKSEPLFPRLQ